MPDTTFHYRIIGKLGAGGMGEVYLAEDTELQRKVAIKFLKEKLGADDRTKSRLIREARAAAKLDHPNICSVYEVGEHDGRSFIAMQYVEGDTLDKRIKRGPLQLQEVLALAIQVADALSEAHSKGVIHRDIKPQNVMITSRRQAKVMDFGLAKVVQGQAPAGSTSETELLLTAPGAVLGTAPYMSPEQMKGEPLDSGSDVFSLGAVLYEMITGQRAFPGENNAEIISAVLSEQPASLARYAPDTPDELQRIVSKCLEKDRSQRYTSSHDLLVDLRGLRRRLDSGAGIQKRRVTPALYLAAGVVLLAILAVGIGVYLTAGGGDASRINRIAVLPFVNEAGDQNVEYLSDGITETLINSLSELPELVVVSRNSVFRFKGREADAQAAGRELKVQGVLIGRIRQREGNYAISAELVEVSSNRHLWGQVYNLKPGDILTVQDRIAREISDKLRIKPTTEERRQLAKRYTDDTEAYQLYLKGRFYLNKRTPEALNKGIEFFNQALGQDRDYALAYAGLADAYELLEAYGASPAREAFPRAEEAARIALHIDDSLAEAHTSLGHARLYYWDWAGAETEYRRAIQLKPTYSTAHHWYANLLIARGDIDGAFGEMNRALATDPLSLVINEAAGWHLYLAGRYAEALEQQHKTLAMDPQFIPAHSVLGKVYLQTQAYDLALKEFQTAIDLSGGNPAYLAEIARAYAVGGHPDKARQVLAELNDMAKQRYVMPYQLARVYTAVGDYEHAFVWLNKAYEEGGSDLIFVKIEPAFEGLRGDPRFGQLLARIGLTP
jgi:serine/threonine-protein kinase